MEHAPALPKSVLVVEDDDSIAAALEFVLRRDKLRCDRVARGSEALPRIRAMHPDLVLLDIMLPEVSGYEICASLRADLRVADIKVLMMTARGSATEQRKSIEVGADGFVTKPFDLGTLRAEISRLLATA